MSTTEEKIAAWTEENTVSKDAAMVAAALAAYHAGDADAGEEVTITSASRNVGCSGSGPEMFRRVRYPGGRDGDEGVWPEGDRLPALGLRASERRASANARVPVGTLICEFSRDRYRGRGGKCSVRFGLVATASAEGKTRVLWLTHRTLRSRPVYEIALPDGSVTTWARRAQ